MEGEILCVVYFKKIKIRGNGNNVEREKLKFLVKRKRRELISVSENFWC